MLNLTLSFLSLASTNNSPYFSYPSQCKSHAINLSFFSSKFARFFNTALLSISTNNLNIKKCEFLYIFNTAITVHSTDLKIDQKFYSKTLEFSYGNLIISNTIFKNCNSPDEGGALKAQEINIALICNSFYRNTAHICGAAQLISCHSIQWFGNIFTGNKADYNGAFTIDTAEAGDIRINITIESTNISSNKAEMWTGGFRIDSSGGRLSNCIIDRNSARVTGGFLDFSWTPAHRNVDFCIFFNNTSKMRGGAVCAFHLMHSSHYFKSLFIKNKCEDESDAISIQSIDSKIVIEDSFFDGPKDEQIGMKFGYSTFEIIGGTKFNMKDSSMKKNMDNLSKKFKKELKNRCKEIN